MNSVMGYKFTCGLRAAPDALKCPLSCLLRLSGEVADKEHAMNIENLTIEQLADLRDKVISTLSDKVSARQRELSGEAERLSAILGQPNGKTPPKVRAKRPLKYRDGDREWVGVGSMPGWLSAKKALGEDIEKYRV